MRNESEKDHFSPRTKLLLISVETDYTIIYLDKKKLKLDLLKSYFLRFLITIRSLINLSGHVESKQSIYLDITLQFTFI